MNTTCSEARTPYRAVDCHFEQRVDHVVKELGIRVTWTFFVAVSAGRPQRRLRIVETSAAATLSATVASPRAWLSEVFALGSVWRRRVVRVVVALLTGAC